MIRFLDGSSRHRQEGSLPCLWEQVVAAPDKDKDVTSARDPIPHRSLGDYFFPTLGFSLDVLFQGGTQRFPTTSESVAWSGAPFLHGAHWEEGRRDGVPKEGGRSRVTPSCVRIPEASSISQLFSTGCQNRCAWYLEETRQQDRPKCVAPGFL